MSRGFNETGMQLHLGDCLAVLPTLADHSVNLILTDPPYFKFKGDAWDNQWAKPAQFIAWLDRVMAEFQRILKPGGSMYVFASARMAARVECLVAERLRVLNHIVWVKPDAAGAEKGARAGTIRSYVPQTERVIFASHANPLGDTLRAAMQAVGITALELNRRAFGRSTGLVSLWLCDRHAHGACEPSRDDWLVAMRVCGVKVDASDYEALARPFRAQECFTDAWHFPFVKSYPGKHPCEKPSEMLEHIIRTSSRPGEIVLDAFMGRGSTGIAARKLGRAFIGIEMGDDHFAAAQDRLSLQQGAHHG